MNFIAYKSDPETWTNHFILDKNKKQIAGLNIIRRNTQTGAGTLKVITPTAEVVKRVKATIKRVRKSTKGPKQKKRKTATKKRKNGKKSTKKQSKKKK